MAHRRRLIALTLLVAILFSATLSSTTTSAVETRIGLLAVSKNGGTVISATIRLAPGACRINISPAGLVAKDTAASTRLAVLYGSLLAGKDPCTIDADISFYASERVSGPSASGFIAYTVYLLLANRTTTPSFTMTGALSLTGIILPVEGVSEKVQAAINIGYKEVYVPLGEAPNTTGNTIVREVCSLPLMALGSHTYQARPWISINSLEEVFRDTASKLIKLLRRLGGNTTLLQDAEKLYAEGDYYSSASLAFTGTLSALTRKTAATKEYNYTLESIILSTLGFPSANSLRRAAVKALQNVTIETPSGYIDLWRFDAKAQAYARLLEAQHAYSSPKPLDKYYGLLRFFSVIGWAQLASKIKGPLVRETQVANRLQLLHKYLSEALTVVSSLTPSQDIRMPDDRPAYQWLQEAQHALRRGDILGAYSRHVRLLSILESTLTGIMPLRASHQAIKCFNNTLAAYWALCPRCATPSSILYSSYADKTSTLLDDYSSSSLYGSALATSFAAYIILSPISSPPPPQGELEPPADTAWITASTTAMMLTTMPLAALLAIAITSRRE